MREFADMIQLLRDSTQYAGFNPHYKMLATPKQYTTRYSNE